MMDAAFHSQPDTNLAPICIAIVPPSNWCIVEVHCLACPLLYFINGELPWFGLSDLSIDAALWALMTVINDVQ
jgi:hypothetical protein